MLLSINNGYITRLFKNKKLVFLGEISYGIYILQDPFFRIISSYSVKKYFKVSDYSFIFFSRLLVLIFISALVYNFFEKPMKSKIKAIFSKYD